MRNLFFQGRLVFDITSKIISAIDCLAMNYTSVDQIAPYIRDILVALETYPNLPSNFQGIVIIKKWIDMFHSKQASDELSESELRQLKFDIENVMNQFNENVLGQK